MIPMKKKINSNDKEKIMEVVNKVNNEREYETSWDEKGIPKFKKKSEIKKGKSSKARGAKFELKVRKDLEDRKWIVDKWSNNVDLEESKLIPAKRKFNPFSKVMTIGTGFPDFIAIKKMSEGMYSIIGVEAKINGMLSKEEKEKCRWYLKNEIFPTILIASSIREGRKINVKYEDFKERYGL